MDIYLYNVSDDNRVLNKTLKDEKIINDIRLKQPVDIVSPSLILKSDTFILYNYAYIPVFERYYFISNITNQSNKVFTLDLKVDVLMSFKDDILTSKGLIINDDVGNKYLDVDAESEIIKEFEIYTSETVLEIEPNIIVNIFGR